MIRGCVILLLVSASAIAVELPDTLTVDGITYKSVVYKSHDAERLRVMHDAGIAAFPIGTLPADLRAKLGYDASAASETAAAKAVQQRLYYEREQKKSALKKLKEKAWVVNRAKVFQVTQNGALLESTIYIKGTITNSHKVSAKSLMHPERKKTVITRREGLIGKRLGSGDRVFVETNETLVDGGTYSGTLYPIGTKSYKGIDGARRTVAAFTDIPKVAMKAHGLQ